MSKSTCSFDGCERPSRKLGLCTMHYQRQRAEKNPCVVAGCKSALSYRSTGFCSGHQRRYLSGADLTPVPSGKVHKSQYTDSGLKICKTCDEALDVSMFHKDSGSPDGFRAQCKPCRGEYMAEYHAENREARMEYVRARRVTHADHVRALDRERYARNRDKRIALASDNTRARRSRMAGVLTDSGLTVARLREIHGDRCCYCDVEMTFERGKRGDGIKPNRATLEHIYPISRGGSHTFLNSALACHECNTSKNDKTVAEWEVWKAGDLYGREKAASPRKGGGVWRDGSTAVLF